MGRVAKYKKVKSVDLFKQKGTPVGAVWGFPDNGRKPKKRSATAVALRNQKIRRRKKRVVKEDGLFDLPPDGEDEFDLCNPMGTVRKQKPKRLDEGLVEHNQTTVVSGGRSVLPETNGEAAKVARVLKIDLEPKKEAATPRGRMEGESMTAFGRRVKSETRQIIKREAEDRHNPEKRQRRKEFLNNKKKKKRQRLLVEEEDHYGNTMANDAVEDTFITGEQAATFAFGEQVERPPVFEQLPRGAKARDRSEKKSSSKVTMNDSQVKEEQKAMEKMRQKVQAQYALIKAKRKKAGEFHL